MTIFSDGESDTSDVIFHIYLQTDDDCPHYNYYCYHHGSIHRCKPVVPKGQACDPTQSVDTLVPIDCGKFIQGLNRLRSACTK